MPPDAAPLHTASLQPATLVRVVVIAFGAALLAGLLLTVAMLIWGRYVAGIGIVAGWLIGVAVRRLAPGSVRRDRVLAVLATLLALVLAALIVLVRLAPPASSVPGIVVIDPDVPTPAYLQWWGWLEAVCYAMALLQAYSLAVPRRRQESASR